MAKDKKAPYSPPNYNIRGAKVAGSHSLEDLDNWLDYDYWISVVSSTVSSIRYNSKTKELMVEFIPQNQSQVGTMSVYTNVPRDVARDMYNSSSQGKFVHYRLRGKYPHQGNLIKRV